MGIWSSRSIVQLALLPGTPVSRGVSRKCRAARVQLARVMEVSRGEVASSKAARAARHAHFLESGGTTTRLRPYKFILRAHVQRERGSDHQNSASGRLLVILMSGLR